MEIKQKRYSNRTGFAFGEDEHGFTIDQSATRNLVVEEADVTRAFAESKPRAKGPKEPDRISLKFQARKTSTPSPECIARRPMAAPPRSTTDGPSCCTNRHNSAPRDAVGAFGTIALQGKGVFWGALSQGDCSYPSFCLAALQVDRPRPYLKEHWYGR